MHCIGVRLRAGALRFHPHSSHHVRLVGPMVNTLSAAASFATAATAAPLTPAQRIQKDMQYCMQQVKSDQLTSKPIAQSDSLYPCSCVLLLGAFIA
jgi:hypothetical protein